MERNCYTICEFLQEPTFPGEGDTVGFLAKLDLEPGLYAVDALPNDGGTGS